MNPTPTGKLLSFNDFREYSDIYIETGSCYGGSILKAIEAGFTKIKSVEVFHKFYQHCFDLFLDKKEIELFLGKSSDELPKMFVGITKPCVIFLDAHPAGPNTGGHDDLMEKGNASEFHQDAILTRELSIILGNNNSHIIIIDDQNGENPENEVYMKMCTEANPKYKFYFYDEQAGPAFYKNKSLVCIPEEPKK